GEFGFALLTLALQREAIGGRAAQAVLASIVISMAIAPLMIRHNGRMAKRAFGPSYERDRQLMETSIEYESHHLSNHVIICGYGRIGQNVARLLEQEDIDYVALDLDPLVVRKTRAAGDIVHYGDSTRREILTAAGLERARALLVSFDDTPATSKILQHTRELRPDMPVLVRTRDDTNLERFQAAGATEVVPETLEASLMLASHLLLLLDVPVSRVLRYVRDVRSDRYTLLRGFFHGAEPEPLDQADRFRKRLTTVTLPPGAGAIGRRLQDLDIEDAGAEVTAVRRGGIRGPQPEPHTELRAGDVLILYGTPEALERGEAKLLKGKS
ncbi:MAG: potassium transporter, partial [Gammaproteobacteria bacterium]|nr:potassium transporter [Gammaproteobacteria bacterium]